MSCFPMSEKSALEKIQELESQIQTLKQDAIQELTGEKTGEKP